MTRRTRTKTVDGRHLLSLQVIELCPRNKNNNNNNNNKVTIYRPAQAQPVNTQETISTLTMAQVFGKNMRENGKIL